MAAAIREELGAAVVVTRGWPGEFTVGLGGRVLARRRWFRPPPMHEVLTAVGRALRDPRGSDA